MLKKILITGGAGFIGFHLSRALAEKGDEVIVVDNLSNYYDVQLKKDRLKQIKNKIKFYQIDIANLGKLRRVFKENKIDKVCHLAAQTGVRYSLSNPFEYERTNVLGTLNILELMKEFEIKDFIFASSSSIYGGNKKMPFSVEDRVDKPISLYAATKRANELMAYTYHKLYDFNCIGLRLFTVYGPWGRPDMALFKFTKNILEGNPINVYNYGKMKRDFTYIADVVGGILSALEKNFGFEIFNLGNSIPVELDYFIECIERELGKKAKRKLMEIQPGDVPETFADIEKSKKMLGFEPKIKIEEGIKKFVEWYKEYYGSRDAN